MDAEARGRTAEDRQRRAEGGRQKETKGRKEEDGTIADFGMRIAE
jgi:hypothetical protein